MSTQRRELMSGESSIWLSKSINETK